MRVGSRAWGVFVGAALLGACGASQTTVTTTTGGTPSPCALTSAELAAPVVSTANYDPTPPPAPSASP